MIDLLPTCSLGKRHIRRYAPHIFICTSSFLKCARGEKILDFPFLSFTLNISNVSWLLSFGPMSNSKQRAGLFPHDLLTHLFFSFLAILPQKESYIKRGSELLTK